jgi:hypothetical protein
VTAALPSSLDLVHAAMAWDAATATGDDGPQIGHLTITTSCGTYGISLTATRSADLAAMLHTDTAIRLAHRAATRKD